MAQLVCFGYVVLVVNYAPYVRLLPKGVIERRSFADWCSKNRHLAVLTLCLRRVGRYKKDEADFTNQARCALCSFNR